MVIKDCWDLSESSCDHVIHEKLQDPTRDPRFQDFLKNPNNPDSLGDASADSLHSDKLVAGALVEPDFVQAFITPDGLNPWDGVKFLRGITIMESYMQPMLKGRDVVESIQSISSYMMAPDADCWDESDEAPLENRYRHRTLFSTCGVDILWFSTARELFHGIAGAIIGEGSGSRYFFTNFS